MCVCPVLSELFESTGGVPIVLSRAVGKCWRSDPTDVAPIVVKRVLCGVSCGERLRQWCCWLSFDIWLTFDTNMDFRISDTREGLAVECVVRNVDDRQKC